MFNNTDAIPSTRLNNIACTLYGDNQTLEVINHYVTNSGPTVIVLWCLYVHCYLSCSVVSSDVNTSEHADLRTHTHCLALHDYSTF